MSGEKVQSAVDLADGDLITIGSVSFVLRVFQKTASTASASEEAPDP